MTSQKYPALTIQTLIRANVERSESPAGFNHHLANWSVLEWGGAAVGEFGEACNVAKKLIRSRDHVRGNRLGETDDILREQLGREIADGIIYAVLWAAAAGIDLEAAIRDSFNQKSDELGYPVHI